MYRHLKYSNTYTINCILKHIKYIILIMKNKISIYKIKKLTSARACRLIANIDLKHKVSI